MWLDRMPGHLARVDGFTATDGRPGATFFTDSRARVWETPAGFEGGTLLIGHLDVPLEPTVEFKSLAVYLWRVGFCSVLRSENRFFLAEKSCAVQ